MPSTDDYLCVPRFLQRALRRLGQPELTLTELARELDVRVPCGHPNPLALRIAKDSDDTGVPIGRVRERTAAIMKTAGLAITFRHIPFNTIPFAKYWEALSEMLDARVQVGIGYNFAALIGTSGLHRHVSGVVALAGDTIQLDDEVFQPAGEKPFFPVEIVERAVLSARDGFWTLARLGEWPESTLIPETVSA